ncbi:sensor histidine kinase [Parashewanella tropica]|uniref:sensor histidine kinase n=1 Tax=Parashewanella tropica TaxID=2547970 RepID=UPI001059A5DD|nr:ATP-binding protein [Parashewanella tropica]
MNSKQVLQASLWVMALTFSSVFSALLWHSQGVNAVVLVSLLSSAGLVYKLIVMLLKQQKDVARVLTALANGDPSFGLSSRHPLQQKMQAVAAELKRSRELAEEQVHYLQTVLHHLDLAILVVDDTGNIIQKNPACERLLGGIQQHSDSLGKLGKIIDEVNDHQRLTLSWQRGDHQDMLSVQINRVRIHGQNLKLVSVQSIYIALQAKEQQAYKKLTKVLTHEIANSITPLTSLAQTATGLLPDTLAFDDEDDKQDLQLALATIANRTQHLNQFISQFRQLSQLPKPDLKPISLRTLIESVITLFTPQWQQQKVNFTSNISSDYQLMADPSQIEQVLINLMKNATEAITYKDEKHIGIELKQNRQSQVIVDITDSGQGVQPEVVDMMFVPFFTTKPQGSGIGLSLSHHIMIQHGGDLGYINNTNKGACFRLTFG